MSSQTALFILVWLIGLCSASDHYHDYIIVGAGPAGLQFGYYLQKAGRDYVILERAAQAGSFFTKYPRHDQLISINKRHTGKTNVEFNLRHDWNSLISDDPQLKFGLYSRLLFPNRVDLVRYLNDFATRLRLNVHFDTDVRNVSSVQPAADGSRADETRFTMFDQHGNMFSCRTLIVATGIWQPVAPPIDGDEYFEGYESVSVNPEDYEGQTVLILGRGNSAFEVAQQIYGSTNLIHMIGRSRVRLSWSTHYVGDIRAVNNALLDTYQLKSLDAVLEAPVEFMRIKRQGGKYYLQVKSPMKAHQMNDTDAANSTTAGGRLVFPENNDNFAMREPYDRIIRCLGFRFNESLFGADMRISHPKSIRKSKYPKIDHGYESVDYPGLYFAGGASHSLDLRKSAGGFIHGFRYTARALHRLLEWKNHAVPWPARSGAMIDLIDTIVKRINEASGIYQMFGMLGDIVILRGSTFEYLEEFPVNLLHQLPQRTGHDVTDFIVVMLEYGANFSGPGKDVFRVDRATGDPSNAHESNFLHPVFYYYENVPTAAAMARRRRHENLPRPDRLHHCVEDFLTNWDAPLSHIQPMRRFLGAVLGRDLREYFSDSCLVASLTRAVVPMSCEQLFLKGRGLERPAFAGAFAAPMGTSTM